MLKLAVVLVKLVVVQQLVDVDGAGVRLILPTGERPLLRSTHPSFEYYLRLTRRSVERKRPIGLAIYNDEVQRVILADQDVVRDLVTTDNKTLKILFSGHDGSYSLDRAHPEFKRLDAVLERSKQNQSAVWFAARIPNLEIQDVATADQLGIK